MKSTAIILIIVIIFCLIGVIFSNPLVFNFKEKLPYAYAPAPVYAEEHLVPGDYLLLYYIYWLFKDYFMTPGQNLFREPYMFSISGWPRPFEPRGLPSSVLFLMFSFCGNPCAYNCMVILSFILCGLFVFLLAKKYLKNTIAAIVSGIIFAVSPFRLTQLFGGHPTGFLLFWIPLIIYLYELLWEKRRWIFGWLAGLSIFCMTMEEHHMGYYTALFTIAFWLYKYFFCNKGKLNFVKFLWLLVPIGIGWLAAMSYMMYIKTIVISTSIAGGGRTFDEISLYSPTINNIFQRINADGEKCIYIGIVTSILIIIGLFKRISLKHRQNGFTVMFYFLVFSVSLLLSLGPNLKYLPIYKLCYKIIPFFHYPRVPGRMFMYTLLAMSLLAGYGIKSIMDIINKKWLKYTVVYSAILVLCLDFHLFTRIGLSNLPGGNKTYDHIKNTAPNNPLLEIPIWPGESSWTAIYFYYTTLYRFPVVNGYSPFVPQRYVDEIFWPLVSINMGMINARQYELLKQLNIKYINLHEEVYPQKISPFPFKTTLKNLKGSPYLKFILKDDPIYLFEILDKSLTKPASLYTIPSKTGIFYECEYMPHRIGNVVEDKFASGNKTLYAKEIVAKPAHMVFGPWQLFPPGKYKLVFRIKLDTASTKDKTATLEVTTYNGEKQITYKDLFYSTSPGYKDYLLHFTLDELTPLEFRIIYYGGKPISADYVYLLCEETSDPVWKYEAEELFHTGREINNAVFVTPKKDPKGIMLFGPYRRYPEGKYRVGFHMKAGEKSDKPAASIEVTSGHSEEPIVKKDLQDIPTEYKTYYLDFSLDKPTVLEFRIEYLGEVPLYVDYLHISRLS